MQIMNNSRVSIFLLVAAVFSQIHNSVSQYNGKNFRTIKASSLNQKAVGLLLKANGRRYYMSSELCPGGIFLTRPVNENCLCYNGIFQIVRECCHPAHTRIHSDNLEWRMDFKCGSSTIQKNDTDQHHPIRAILPLSKPHNRFGSMIITRSLVGNNTDKWRKFDTDDIIRGNDARVNMNGKMQFEIVNIKPLGRDIRIMFGKSSQMTVCYAGWLTKYGHQNLRVRMLTPGELSAPSNCCFNITKFNTPGVIRASCTNGTITTEIVDVQSADIDLGQCDQRIPDEAPHVINKRNNPYDFESSRGIDELTKESNRNFPGSSSLDDIVGDRGPILVKRQAPATENAQGNATLPGGASAQNESQGEMIIARNKGISKATEREQALAINEFIAILRNDMSVEMRKPQTPRFQLLKTSIDIFMSVVPNEVVPHGLVQTAFDVFYFLYEELDPVIHVPPEEFTSTVHYLHKCLKHEKMLNFTTIGCPRQIDEVVIDESVQAKLNSYYKNQPKAMKQVLRALRHPQIRRDRRFIPELHDIYVEINWKVIDFVHSLCFDHFGKEFNAHTYFETEMEALLTMNRIRLRWLEWNHEDLRYVRGIFPVSDLILSMKQLDKVTAVGHLLSRYNGSYWLQRPQIEAWEKITERTGELLRTQDSNSESRLIFVKNLLDDVKVESISQAKSNALPQTRLTSGGIFRERTLKYPFEHPDKLPSGELIWDGMAICLHAHYSSSRSYFVDSEMWGISPSLQELGQSYP